MLNEDAFRYATSRSCDGTRVRNRALGNRFLRGEFAVSLAALHEMPAHGVSRLLRCVSADCLKDRLVLFLDAAKIPARAVGVSFERTNTLPRNDQAPEKIEEFDEPVVLCRRCNRLMEGKVLLDRAFTTGDGAAED